MAIANTRVKRFSPTGASDSLDATDEFPGACSAITNLVPDLSTRNVWTCIPKPVALLDFNSSPNLPGGHSAGQAVVFKVVGSFVYGLFLDATSLVDRPFAFNLLTSSWVTVTGPGAIPSTYSGVGGAGKPVPTMDLVGTHLIVTHPNYIVPGTYFGVFTISNPAAPVYTTGDITGAITFSGLGLTRPVDWVRQFNQRAYYGCNGISQPSAVASDVLNSGNVTNASQVLTFGDNLPLTAAAGLPLSNQLGGIIQSLMIFKGIENIYQVTGDFALTNISINTLNIPTGTASPRTIVSTPLGLAFVSPDGLRIIDQSATISPVIGSNGSGISIPMSSISGGVLTSNIKMAAGCDGSIIRIGFSNNLISFEQEYWYDLTLKTWSGPHDFVPNMYDLYNGSFVVSTDGLGSSFYSAPRYPLPASTFSGTFTLKSAMLEDNGQMAASELSEMQIVAASAASNTLTVTLLDSSSNTINSSSVTINPTGATPGLAPYKIDFPAISVFNRMSVQVTGNSAAGVRIGDVWMRLKTLGYIPPPPNPPTS